ncbi:GNAT family N-acetyltransferase [Microbacterium sp. zg.Y625]|uniref:GNAT family N-acetyltransferase n=1 Tax=Microbacterium jiangjiandongii TaxID=3049071 RepID=UPI00214B86F3|nr:MULTISPECIES: GNAT family N-acetyltransferase [unclassified Microbacterium]MCR2791770.1 GNAT family N-acetyltransferase [Microbacterium sp. zg.Y625]WIM24587.1 GNAT family N-acetyltransferase [Microbacterium sp. zg-Y625]
MTLQIRTDDLTGEATCALIAAHLDAMHAQTPTESVHALGVEQLRQRHITVWSAWEGDDLAGVGALQRRDATHGEIKSMRVASTHLRRGVARALLRHIVAEARVMGLLRLQLETGSGPDFAAARALYLGEGFTPCGPFGDYTDDPLSTYFVRELPR